MESFVQTTMANINDWYREHQISGSPLSPVVIGSTYTGSDRCQKCHPGPFKVFEGSAHASAIQTLTREGQAFNPECLSCHTTGYGKPAGYANQGATPHLAGVQCEACHGPSSGHPEGVSEGFGRSGMGPCLACHTRDNSPEFNFASYWERIRH